MKTLGLGLILVVVLATLAFGLPSVQHVCGSWDQHNEAVSYKLYWRAPGGSFTDANSVDVGNVTGLDITAKIDIAEGDYEWAVTAVRNDGSETGFSEVVLHPFYQTPQGAVSGFSVRPCE